MVLEEAKKDVYKWNNGAKTNSWAAHDILNATSFYM